ncbi:hypothetical protein FPV67DRAFT_1789441 [Lyophyllum atratum]|nr:hypothetical protein FPV67DRAFT_1789441 [Lyophyllum atratum]
MAITRQSSSRQDTSLAATRRNDGLTGAKPARKATAVPIQSADHKRRVNAQASAKVRVRRNGPNIMSAIDRKALLDSDPWATNVQPTSVQCRGCNKTQRLDDRHGEYYGFNWKKHKRTCKGIKKAEAAKEERLAGPKAPESECTTPEMTGKTLSQEYNSYEDSYPTHSYSTQWPREFFAGAGPSRRIVSDDPFAMYDGEFEPQPERSFMSDEEEYYQPPREWGGFAESAMRSTQ